MALRAGDWVEVRSAEEILGTLDASGELGALPFMPEMLRHCGRRYRVSKRAHKTCDTITKTGIRHMEAAVHLEDLRCDGSGHGGCQARCLFFWKEAWLAPVPGPAPEHAPASPEDSAASRLRAQASRTDAEGETVYRCQVTELLRATRPLSRWNPLPYLEDLRSGNVGLGEFVRALAIALYNRLPVRLRRGRRYPSIVPALHGRTPSESLGIQPGERVRVRSVEEIQATLNQTGKNRGLWFDVEMVPYCGRTYRVLDRVERIIDERTGRLTELTSDCLMLEGVICRSQFSDKGRLFCPRRIHSYWREIWLERAGTDS